MNGATRAIAASGRPVNSEMIEMSQTLGDVVWTGAARRQAVMRDVLLVAAGSMFVAVCAKLQFPSLPVPMTMQPFAVLLVGACLGARRGGLALVAYLLEGLAGLPVFAGPVSGPTYFAGPTAGYLFSFPIAAFVVGSLTQLGWDRRFSSTIAAFALGQGIILALGFVWLACQIGAASAFSDGVLRFLIGDVLKLLLAGLAFPAAWRLVSPAPPKSNS